MAGGTNIFRPIRLLLLVLSSCGPDRPSPPVVAHPPTAKPTPPPASKPSARAPCPPLAAPKAFKQALLQKGEYKYLPRTAEAARLVPVITRRIDAAVRDLARDPKKRDVVPRDLCAIRIDELLVVPDMGARVELTLSIRGEERSVDFSMSRHVAKKGERVDPDSEWTVDELLQVLDGSLLRMSMTSWLSKHPEFLSVSDEDGLSVEGIDVVRSHWRWVRAINGSTICVRSADPARTWCWQEKRPIEKIDLRSWSFERRSPTKRKPNGEEIDDLEELAKRPAVLKRPITAQDPIAGFVDLSLTDGKRELWAVRLPAVERVLVGTSTWRPSTPRESPFWLAEPPKRALEPQRDSDDRKLMLATVPKSGFARFPTVPEPDLGPLRRVGIKPIYSRSPGLFALELTEDASDDKRLCHVCVRLDRWSCAEPMGHDRIDEAIVARESIYRLPSRGGKPRFVIQTSSKEQGGNGAGSGGKGTTDLDLYELDKDELSWLGSLQIGEMSWITVLFNDESDGPDRHYERLTSSYAHPHEPAGDDCLRIGKIKEVRAFTDGEFSWLRAARRDKSVVRLKAPPTAPLEGNRFMLPARSEKSMEKDDPNDQQKITLVPLTGLWQLQPKALVQVSADPKGTCPSPRQ